MLHRNLGEGSPEAGQLTFRERESFGISSEIQCGRMCGCNPECILMKFFFFYEILSLIVTSFSCYFFSLTSLEVRFRAVLV